MKIKAYWLSQEWAKRGAIHVHCLWWVEDQPNIIAALNCKNKDEQLKMLKEAVNWYSFYINNWNPMISRSDASEDR